MGPALPTPAAVLPASSGAPAPARLGSLDVLRGLTILAMILVNGQFSPEDAHPAFAHSAWSGWTFADTIFPTFLFLVGISLTLSTAARLGRGEPRAQLVQHALRRAVLLYACGLAIDFINLPAHGFPFVALQSHVQLTGVLEKIAVCYLLAFFVHLGGGWRGAAIGVVAANAIYLALLFLYPVPGCGPGVLTPECAFPGWLDRTVLAGHQWNSSRFDPDGLGSVLGASSTALLGVLAGEFLRREQRWQRRVAGLALAAAASVALAMLLSRLVPINKPLWTTSYVFLMAGLSALALATCMLWVDARHRGVRPLEVLGSNAITAYLISRPAANLARVHVLGHTFHGVLRRAAAPANASLLFAAAVTLGVFVAVWGLDRRGWHLRL
jgi:predicted acyltransferase